MVGAAALHQRNTDSSTENQTSQSARPNFCGIPYEHSCCGFGIGSGSALYKRVYKAVVALRSGVHGQRSIWDLAAVGVYR